MTALSYAEFTEEKKTFLSQKETDGIGWGECARSLGQLRAPGKALTISLSIKGQRDIL